MVIYPLGMITDPQLPCWDARHWRILEYNWKWSIPVIIQLLMIRPHSSLKQFTLWISAVEACWKIEKETHQYTSVGLQDSFLGLFLIVTVEWIVTLQEHRWIYMNSLPWLPMNNGRQQQSKTSSTKKWNAECYLYEWKINHYEILNLPSCILKEIYPIYIRSRSKITLH